MVNMEQGSIRLYCSLRFRQHILRLSVFLLSLGIAAIPAFSAQQKSNLPTLTYIKVMKGSVPEYTSVTVNANGVGSYQGRQLDESPRPRPLKLSASTTEKLFRLATSLGNFRSIRLESKVRVANLGEKTFIYRDGVQENKVEFNYTRNKRGEELLNLFEGIADVEQHITALEYSSRYDLLGLPSALTQVEIDLNNNAMVDPQLMVPILKKIVGNNQYMRIAQMRAENILQRIQDSRNPRKSGRRLF